MTPRSANPVHLTDAQFADCLGSAPSTASNASARTHLAECAACRMELEQFEATLEDFSTVTMNWSEAQPTFSPRAVVQKQKRAARFTGAGWAVATALILGIAGPAIWHREREPLATVAVQQTAANEAVEPDSAAQIAQDNKMLQSVNMAISAPVSSPLREYGLDGRRSGARQRNELRDE